MEASKTILTNIQIELHLYHYSCHASKNIAFIVINKLLYNL